MTPSQSAVGVLAFLSCSAAFVVTLGKAKLSALAAGASSSKKPRFEHGLIELEHPRQGPQRVSQLLVNDEVLMRSVREIGGTLYVYVRSAADEPKSNVCEYISTVYSRLWDEMLQAECMSLNCVVVGDVDGAGFISRSQLQGLPQLQSIMSFDAAEMEAVKRNRASGGLAELQFTEVYSRPAPFPAGSVFFFDALGCDIPRFKRVCMGGTFDNLHNGHKKLLALAAASCEGSLVVGITGDEMLKKKSNASAIAGYPTRASAVATFLSMVKPALKLEAVELTDPFGPAATDKAIEAIVVSSETISGAHKINHLRREKGLPPLAILVTRRGEGATLSSTFLRRQGGRKRRAIMSALSSFASSISDLFR